MKSLHDRLGGLAPVMRAIGILAAVSFGAPLVFFVMARCAIWCARLTGIIGGSR